ncbi:MAG: hypothetical protein J6E42_08360 [Firmicutes bacterium]|nr:hypothetical protein [Bacillota bacterium]
MNAAEGAKGITQANAAEGAKGITQANAAEGAKGITQANTIKVIKKSDKKEWKCKNIPK